MRRHAGGRVLIAVGIAAFAFLIVEALTGSGIGWDLIALTLLAFVAGRARSRPAGLWVIALLLAGIAGSQVLTPELDSIVPELMLPITFFITGYALRAREALAAGLAAQGADIEAEREVYTQLSVRYERARIAAELHDVVAHAISVMVVQAGAGQRLAVADPARVDETFTFIATAARQAEADLDHLASLLAQDSVGIDAELALVHEIVDRASAAGLPVTLRFEGDGTGVNGAVSHAAFRVVQEGLTNALRYAPAAPVRVHVRAWPASLVISVVNEPPDAQSGLGLGTGRGLTGLREAVSACGGTLQAGRDGAGGWALRATIPY